MRKIWKSLIEMAGAVAFLGLIAFGGLGAFGDIYPVGPDTVTGIQTTSKTPFASGVTGGYVPLAGGSGVGESMTGPLYVGSAAQLDTQWGIFSYNQWDDDTPGGQAAAVLGISNRLTPSVLDTYGVYGLINYNQAYADQRGSAVFGEARDSVHAIGVRGSSDLGPSGLFLPTDGSNTSPTLILRLATGQTAGDIHVLEIQDADRNVIAYIRGDGVISAVAGIFSNSVVTPAVTSGLTGNVPLAFSAVGTEPIEFNDSVETTNAGSWTYIPGSAVVIDGADDTIPMNRKTVLLNPTNGTTITLTGAPTVTDFPPEGTLVDVSLASAETGAVVVQDQSVLPDSNLLLGARTRTIRYPGHLLLRSNGTDMEEQSFTPGGVGHDTNKTVVWATVDFGSTAAGTSSDEVITVPGAESGDVVTIGPQNGSVPDTGSFWGWVSSPDSVTVRFINNALVAAKDPSSGRFTIIVEKP